MYPFIMPDYSDQTNKIIIVIIIIIILHALLIHDYHNYTFLLPAEIKCVCGHDSNQSKDDINIR